MKKLTFLKAYLMYSITVMELQSATDLAVVTRYVDGTKPNQTGNVLGENKKAGEADRKKRKSSHQRTSSPGRETEETIK